MKWFFADCGEQVPGQMGQRRRCSTASGQVGGMHDFAIWLACHACSELNGCCIVQNVATRFHVCSHSPQEQAQGGGMDPGSACGQALLLRIWGTRTCACTALQHSPAWCLSCDPAHGRCDGCRLQDNLYWPISARVTCSCTVLLHPPEPLVQHLHLLPLLRSVTATAASQ